MVAAVGAAMALNAFPQPKVELVECPRCERRMRISDDGLSAKVNVCRLRDDMPDAATLDRRVAEMRARAERYLASGR